jgi:transposase
MATYSTEQRVFILKEYYLSQKHPETVRRRFRKEYNTKDAPHRNTITNLIEKFERTGSVQDDKSGNVGRPSTASTSENVEKLEAMFERSPCKSVRRAAQQLGMSKTTVHRLMRNELKLFPYKIQTHQPLHEQDMARRLDFANVCLNMIENNEIDSGNIWFTDEAHFHLDGYVNKQNWRIWGSENPYFSIQKSLHPRRITVWVALSTGGIIGPVFLNKTITSSLYVNMLKEEFIPLAQVLVDISKSWFMQDGARPHRTRDVFECLNEHFNGRVIALDFKEATGTGIDWPPYSPDFNPCDYFLWGYLKDRVYRSNPKSIEELKNAIQTEISSVSEETLNSVITNFAFRLQCAITNNGSHIENILT